MKAPVFVLLVFSPIAFADTVPLVWSNSATIIYSECDNCESDSVLQIDSSSPLVIENHGLTAGFGENFYYTVDTNFSVVTAGDFLVSGDVYYTGASALCGDHGCTTGGEFSGGFYEDIQILDGSTIVFSQSFGDDASAYNPGCDQCEANIGFFSNESGVVNLPVGDYTLQVLYQDSESSYGEGYGGGFSTTNIVLPPPVVVPEPHFLWLVLVGLTIMLALRTQRRPRQL